MIRPVATRVYLSRYTHRIAISNRRLVAADANTVAFKYKDYRIEGEGRFKIMTLATGEFIRRFLSHVLPKGFHRIRHYGLLANGSRAENIANARQLLALPAPQKEPECNADQPSVHPDHAPAAAGACSSSRCSSADGTKTPADANGDQDRHLMTPNRMPLVASCWPVAGVELARAAPNRRSSCDDRLEGPPGTLRPLLKPPGPCGRPRASASPPAPTSNPHRASRTSSAKPSRDFVPGRFSDVGPSPRLTPPRRHPKNLHHSRRPLIMPTPT